MPDYLLYQLTWNQAKQKYDKRPCRIDGSSLAADEAPPRVSHAVAAAAVRPGYALGMWIDPPMFFIDLDECVADGKLNAVASAIAAPFIAAGCYFEASVSGTGAHVIGKYTGELPAHSNADLKRHTHQFYTSARGCVLNDAHQGSMDVDATPQLVAMLAEFFPPRHAPSELLPVGERRPEWRGPEDDDELIRRALTARGSARQVFGGACTFADLWQGQIPENSRSEADLAMASHLAFWTGCDVQRIERIMRRSGLARDKWNEHRTYLIDKTITHACATTRNVYQEPLRKDVIGELLGASPVPVVTDVASSDLSVVDHHETVSRTIDTINNTGTFKELTDTVMPTLGSLGLPRVHAERVVSALMSRLKIFNSNMPIGLVRQIVTPPTVMDPASFTPPAWFAGFCYIKESDKFYNTATGSLYSVESFRVEFSKFMPLKSGGSTREDPAAWARDHWQVVTVDGLMYRPDQPEFFRYAGREYANSFNPNTMPTPTTPSAHAAACIQHFQSHLYLLCGKRDWLYFLLLGWIAHNVQKPGHKIRWAPLIKGVGGDGKSAIGELLFAALGEANVKITSPSTLTNSGGFTDWATGACVNVIEEIRLEGREKKKLYNAMKLIIGDRRQDLNRKGKASGGTEINITNTIAVSNYADAAPIDDDDRRWLIIFSPYQHIDEAVADKGLANNDELVAHFKMMGDSMRDEPGAWRAWLMSVDLSSFAPDNRAAHTPERESMRLASSDSLDQIVMDIITTGGFGISPLAFASDCVSGRVALSGEPPRHQGWNALLTRLGYMQHHKPVWWMGKTRRIWTKKAMTDEKLKEIMDGTTQP